jgi:hypothetical protein
MLGVRAYQCLPVMLALGALAGCGSSPPASTTKPLTQRASTPPSTRPAAKPVTTRAVAPAPPSFVVTQTSGGGDVVRVEGRLGTPVPASEAKVDLGGCPQPADDGRAVVVPLNLTTTIESGMSGEVTLSTGAVSWRNVNFLMGASDAECKVGEPSNTKVSFGTLQPHQAFPYTIWLVLPDLVSPNDPHPSEKTLRQEGGWFIQAPEAGVVTSSPAQSNSMTGSHVVTCDNNKAMKYVELVSGPQTLTERNLPNQYQEACPSSIP